MHLSPVCSSISAKTFWHLNCKLVMTIFNSILGWENHLQLLNTQTEEVKKENAEFSALTEKHFYNITLNC